MFRSALRFLSATDLLISFAALASCIQTIAETGYRPEIKPFWFLVFFAALTEYKAHRFIKHYLDGKAGRAPYMWALIIGISGLLVSAYFCRKIVLISVLPPALLSLMYTVPIIPYRGAYRRIRDLPLMKTFVVSLTWSWVSVIIPSAYYNIPVETFLGPFLLRFMFMMAVTIPFDIRDMVTDRNESVRTLAHRLGEKGSSILSLLFAILTALTAFYVFGNVHFIGLAYTVSVIIFLIFVYSKEKISISIYYALLDSCLIIQALLVWASALWF